jgi:hypothetical protein
MRNIVLQGSISEHQLGEVRLVNVKLWLPHMHSSRSRRWQPPLYLVHVTFCSPGGGKKLLVVLPQGISPCLWVHMISSFTHLTTMSFSLRVNGHPVFLAGGNWITTNQFLRHLNGVAAKGEELSFDYQWDRKQRPALTNCYCSSVKCGGTLEVPQLFTDGVIPTPKMIVLVP